MNSRRFIIDHLVGAARGTLRTIRDACDYMTSIGKKRELRQHWQRACKLILAHVDVFAVSRALELAAIEARSRASIFEPISLRHARGLRNREIFSNFVQYERLYGAEPQSKMTPFAPILRYRGRREELKGLVRSLISNVVDVRDPIQIAYDQLAKRAEAALV